MRTAIWWARRDLRLSDNQALASALASAKQVIPVFVLDPVLLNAPDAGAKRVAFLLEGLRRLDADLRERGSRLLVRRGDPVEELAHLVSQTGAQAVFAEEDVWPYARQREARVAEVVPLHLTGGLTIHPPQAVTKADGLPYSVFTPYSRAWKALPLPGDRSLFPAPADLPAIPELDGMPIPDQPRLPATVPFPPGEAEARRRLRAFVNGDGSPVYRYAEGRDRLDQDGTSQFSPYLRFGMISARQAVASASAVIEAAPHAQARRGAEIWLIELIWREFYMAILYHFPEVLEHGFRNDLRNIPWQHDQGLFAAWCQGRTGYPVVDAAMRQLAETGWMHNRARMIVASFLVKDLLIDWRWGERFFMQHLVDADPAANNGGWQWTAGTGTDAAPYFRVFNPVLQGKKHDPDGSYVRRWVPELGRVPLPYIHTPWDGSLELQREAGCTVGKDYPAPVVDHGWARERVLAAFGAGRRSL